MDVFDFEVYVGAWQSVNPKPIATFRYEADAIDYARHRQKHSGDSRLTEVFTREGKFIARYGR